MRKLTRAMGRFIVFEGLDGAGTTTQLQRLAEWLRGREIPVTATSEPTAGPVGVVIREVLNGNQEMPTRALALLFAADRADHLCNPMGGIVEMLKHGCWVLCDRYVLSSLAYQQRDGIELDWLVEINKFAPAPDLTVFIDTSVPNCLGRIIKRSTKFDTMHNKEQLQLASLNYLRAVNKTEFTGQLITVDGNDAPDEVFHEVVRGFEEWLQAEDRTPG